MAEASKNSAKDSLGGSIYQFWVTVSKCFELKHGEKVSIETFGDVTILGRNQTEVKNFSDSLTDSHPNFWKTLFNWMQDDYPVETFKSLILLTTQSFGKNARLANWNSLNANDRHDLLTSLSKKSRARQLRSQQNKTEQKRAGKSIVEYQNFVLEDFRKDRLLSVIDRIFIDSDALPTPDLKNKIKSLYLKTLPECSQEEALKYLVGVIVSAPTNDSPWEIGYDLWDRAVKELLYYFHPNEAIFPRELFKRKQTTEAPDEYLFVKKIHDIEYKDVILGAVSDYFNTLDFFHDSIGNYDAPRKIYEDYIDDLIESYKMKYRKAKRNCSEVIRDSQNFYDDQMVEEPRPIKGFFDIPVQFRNGLLHVKMDELNARLRWRLED